MLRKISIALALIVGTAQPLLADNMKVDPKADFKAFREHFMKTFPKVPLNDFVNGPYSMDEGLRKQWQAIEEFPPYEIAVDKGKALFAKKFKNGKTFADCFPNKGIGIRQDYPKFDAKSGEIITLEVAVDQVPEGQRRKAARLQEGRHGGGHRLHGLHLARQADEHQDPERSARARRLSRRARNTSTPAAASSTSPARAATCRWPGKHLRTEVLAPALGIMNALPIYRSNWGGMGTTSRRLTSCNTQVRAASLKPGDEDYRDVEYYLSYMANGLPISGPGARP